MRDSPLLNPPEDIIQYKRNLKNIRRHNDRIRAVKSCIDTSTPKSLGLPHLKTRPKKKQLIEDRHQTVAKENRKLMENMIKIMSEPREQPHHEFHESLNLRERQDYVERVNRHNEIMHSRLKETTAVIDVKKQLGDFERHVKLGNFMKQKSKYRGIPSVGSSGSPKPKSPGPVFDALAYALALPSATEPPTDGSEAVGFLSQSPVPIQTLQDFRRNVLSHRRPPSGPPRAAPSPPRAPKADNDIKLEFVHNPSGKS